MGYYVKIIKSNAVIPAENLQQAYEKMCALNVTHDHKKNGGAWMAGKQTEKWFSWMDANYPETCKDAKEILNQLGFDCDYNEAGDLKIIGYDSKTGQEDLFMDAIQDITIGQILWEGEERERWTRKFYGNYGLPSATSKNLTEV